MEVKVKITIDGQEHEITPQEAKRLRDSLDLAFPKDKEYIPMPYPVYPTVLVQPIWDRPWINPWDTADHWPYYPYTTCQNNADSPFYNIPVTA